MSHRTLCVIITETNRLMPCREKKSRLLRTPHESQNELTVQNVASFNVKSCGTRTDH
jgi:hypothetical protein